MKADKGTETYFSRFGNNWSCTGGNLRHIDSGHTGVGLLESRSETCDKIYRVIHGRSMMELTATSAGFPGRGLPALEMIQGTG